MMCLLLLADCSGGATKQTVNPDAAAGTTLDGDGPPAGIDSADVDGGLGSTVQLVVKETAGIARASELVQNGMPLPREMAVYDSAHMAVLDASNRAVPAEFRVLSRWNAGRDDNQAPIQWVLVSFLADVPANGQATFQLLTDAPPGTNPAPAAPLKVSRVGDAVLVDTNQARFTFAGKAGALFDEIQVGDTVIATGADMSARIHATDTTHASTRKIVVEHAGPLTASVIVDGAYDLPPVGGGALGSRRRYLFAAGSPTAIVRHAVAWEGRFCDDTSILTCDNGATINGLLTEQVRDALVLSSAPSGLLVVGDPALPAVEAAVDATSEASLVQKRRADRAAKPAFEITVPGQAISGGSEASGGMLAVTSASGGGIAVAIRQMHLYEPQALRLLPGGRVSVDLVNDGVWLGNRQGLFATIGVSALAPATKSARGALETSVWAPLNHPLRAWPTPAWFARSGVVEELPAGSLPADLQIYDTVVARTLQKTRDAIRSKGLAGLMTFGLYPRYWGTQDGDEIDCGSGADPTPTEAWDNTYWCTTWTDYHNASATAVLWAMRSGEVGWLDELAFPAALRSLHTQILQCGPDDSFFYCGQAPAGYNGYRSDFNSSHAYFQNLMLYYFLTGDGEVVDTLERGGRSMRNYYCDLRRTAGGPACPPSNQSSDPLVDRVASQWLAVFRFLGLASADKSFLEDFQANLARAATQNYAELVRGSKHYGFWTRERIATPMTNLQTGQLWMASLYDMRNLYRLELDTHDAPIGSPAVRPSAILAGWAATLVDFGATVAGDGTAAGKWSNTLYFDGEGDRVGGRLTTVRSDTTSPEPLLFDTGKACLVGVLARVGRDTQDAHMLALTRDLVKQSLAAAALQDSALGKTPGEFLTQMHAAVAVLQSVP